METHQNSNNNTFSLIADHFTKELKAIFSDKGALLIIVGAMIIYPIIYSIGYQEEVVTEMPAAFVDMDNTSSSRKYKKMLDATPELKVTRNLQSLENAKRLMMNDETNAIILIPDDFESNILKNKSANVVIYADGSYFLKYKNAYMALSLVNESFGRDINIKRYLNDGKSLMQANVADNPLPVYREILYNSGASYGSFIMPGLILIIMQQTLLIGIGLMGGSFSESKVSPFILPKNQRYKEVIPYLLGKSGALLLISIFNVLFAMYVVHDWFNYPDNASFIEVAILLFPFLISTIFLGIAISTFFKHRESALVFMVFLSPIALLLSGISWPITAIPKVLVYISNLFPSSITTPTYIRLRTMGVELSQVTADLAMSCIQSGIYVLFTIVVFYAKVYWSRK